MGESMLAALATLVVAGVGAALKFYYEQRKERRRNENEIERTLKPVDDARKAEAFKATARDPRAARRRLSRLQRASRKNRLTVVQARRKGSESGKGG